MQILRIGCNGTHDSKFTVERPNGYSCYLFLLIKTNAMAIIDNQEVLVQSGSYILYEPNTPHYYHAVSNSYINDWIELDVSNGKEFFDKLNITLNQPVKIWDDSFISKMIFLASEEFYSINLYKEDTSDLLLTTMFTKLSELLASKKTDSNMNCHYSNLIALRREIYMQPNIRWTIPLLAERMNLCAPYFERLFRQTFGISCMNDVINSKISYSKSLLSKTDKTIREIAAECGYNSDIHFMRQFKKNVGATPTEYRNYQFNHNSIPEQKHYTS